MTILVLYLVNSICQIIIKLFFGGESKFNEPDFIKDFRIGKDGNPFLVVEGTAGGTIPQKENSGYAYVFVTNNGTFLVSPDWLYPQWHTHELTLDEKNCVTSMNGWWRC